PYASRSQHISSQKIAQLRLHFVDLVLRLNLLSSVLTTPQAWLSKTAGIASYFEADFIKIRCVRCE
ncbi:MAG: hypothetical protein K8R34_01530, partial [Methanosarcinales archaeon]|nr:hypothetical protein [Methanosarcinales archaeon]